MSRHQINIIYWNATLLQRNLREHFLNANNLTRRSSTRYTFLQKVVSRFPVTLYIATIGQGLISNIQEVVLQFLLRKAYRTRFVSYLVLTSVKARTVIAKLGNTEVLLGAVYCSPCKSLAKSNVSLVSLKSSIWTLSIPHGTLKFEIRVVIRYS